LKKLSLKSFDFKDYTLLIEGIIIIVIIGTDIQNSQKENPWVSTTADTGYIDQYSSALDCGVFFV